MGKTPPNKLKIIRGLPTFLVERALDEQTRPRWRNGRWASGFSREDMGCKFLQIATNLGLLSSGFCCLSDKDAFEPGDWNLMEDGSLSIIFKVSAEVAEAFQNGTISAMEAFDKMNPDILPGDIQRTIAIWDEIVRNAGWDPMADEDALYRWQSHVKTHRVQPKA